MTNQTTAVGMLTDMALIVAVEIAIQQGLNEQENFADMLSVALKDTVYNNLDRVMNEWEEATEANLSKAWLQKLMATQAIELAQTAIKSIS